MVVCHSSVRVKDVKTPRFSQENRLEMVGRIEKEMFSEENPLQLVDFLHLGFTLGDPAIGFRSFSKADPQKLYVATHGHP